MHSRFVNLRGFMIIDIRNKSRTHIKQTSRIWRRRQFSGRAISQSKHRWLPINTSWGWRKCENVLRTIRIKLSESNYVIDLKRARTNCFSFITKFSIIWDEQCIRSRSVQVEHAPNVWTEKDSTLIKMYSESFYIEFKPIVKNLYGKISRWLNVKSSEKQFWIGFGDNRLIDGPKVDRLAGVWFFLQK